MRRVSLHRPVTLAEALALRAQLGTRARLIAGGTDAIVALRREGVRAEPIPLIDLGRLRGLARVEITATDVVLGTLTTHAQLAGHAGLRDAAPLLAEACARIGSPQIRNRGTLGGNIVNASPCADTVPPLLVLDARATLQSVRGSRELPLSEAILAPYRTALAPDEILTAISFRRPQAPAGTAFVKLGRRNALAVSRMSVAAVLSRDTAGRLVDPRVAAGSVAPVPRRFAAVESLLAGQPASADLFAAAGERLAAEMVAITGRRWSTPYKEPVVATLLERALHVAATRLMAPAPADAGSMASPGTVQAVETVRGTGVDKVGDASCDTSQGPARASGQDEGAAPVAPSPDTARDAAAPEDPTLAFVLNGNPVQARSAPGRTLLQLLRDELRLTGTKCGCEIGECGACTVILDGEAVCSCLVLADQVAGHRVETVEGLARAVAPDGAGLHPLQRAFLDQDAVACGFCTPGALMAAKALLDRTPRPTRREIQTALSGNLCRCTGYHPIIAAVEQAARERKDGHGDGT